MAERVVDAKFDQLFANGQRDETLSSLPGHVELCGNFFLGVACDVIEPGGVGGLVQFAIAPVGLRVSHRGINKWLYSILVHLQKYRRDRHQQGFEGYTVSYRHLYIALKTHCSMGKKTKKPRRLGYLLPQHDFFLNPHSNARFTRCPKCDAATKLRKKPLLIFINLVQPVSLNKTCRCCPSCDLLIAHKNELDPLLEAMCMQHYPHLVGQDYLVVGTVERKTWREGHHKAASIEDVFKNLHDFKRHLEFEPARYVWVKEN